MAYLDGSTLIRGDGRTCQATITRLEGSGSLIGAAVRFILAYTGVNCEQTHLLTLTRADSEIEVVSESADEMEVSFTIPGSATYNLEPVSKGRMILQWDLEITPVASQPFTKQGVMVLRSDTRADTEVGVYI